MAKNVTLAGINRNKLPDEWQRVYDQSYKTVPLSFSKAMERLAGKVEQTLSGRFLLKGEDATIDIREGELFCIIKGKVVAKEHPFARFVRANKDGFLGLYESLKEKGLELALITGRFLKNGPDEEPLFASYVLVLFHDGYVNLFNVFFPMFEWEQRAFPSQFATITCSNTELEALAEEIADANSQMMKLIGDASMFEGTYWFADDIRFQA